MGRKLLKTVQTITTFRNPLADPVGTRRGPPLVRGPQFENRWAKAREVESGSHAEIIKGQQKSVVTPKFRSILSRKDKT